MDAPGLTNGGSKTIASHAVKDTRLAKQHHQDHRRQTGNRAQLDQSTHPTKAGMIGCDRNWIRHIKLRIGHNAGGDARNQNVEKRAEQGANR